MGLNTNYENARTFVCGTVRHHCTYNHSFERLITESHMNVFVSPFCCFNKKNSQIVRMSQSWWRLSSFRSSRHESRTTQAQIIVGRLKVAERSKVATLRLDKSYYNGQPAYMGQLTMAAAVKHLSYDQPCIINLYTAKSTCHEVWVYHHGHWNQWRSVICSHSTQVNVDQRILKCEAKTRSRSKTPKVYRHLTFSSKNHVVRVGLHTVHYGKCPPSQKKKINGRGLIRDQMEGNAPLIRSFAMADLYRSSKRQRITVEKLHHVHSLFYYKDLEWHVEHLDVGLSLRRVLIMIFFYSNPGAIWPRLTDDKPVKWDMNITARETSCLASLFNIIWFGVD